MMEPKRKWDKKETGQFSEANDSFPDGCFSFLGQDRFSLAHHTQTASMAYTAHYAMDAGGSFLQSKLGRSVNLIFQVNLVPGLRARSFILQETR